MVLYYICIILIGALYIAFLELSKNMIVGWCIGILATIAMLVYRSVFYKKKKGADKLWPAFLIFAVVLVLNYALSSPPIKRVPAVAN